MAKRKRFNDERSIQKRIAEGRGLGRLSEYNPWLHIQDVPSRGLVTRIKGWKTGRVHHLLSLLELMYFYVLEWSLEIIDIREQYPLLPLEEVVAIAKDCGIRYPTDRRTKHPIVMTTDFVVTVGRDGRDVDQARTLKYRDGLCSKRTLEKLEIERRYWEERGVDWKIVTDREIPTDLAKNVEWVHQYRDLDNFTTLPELCVRQTISTLCVLAERRNTILRDITMETDDRLGLEPGTSLALVRYLIATRRWRVDMNRAINPGRRLDLLPGLNGNSAQ